MKRYKGRSSGWRKIYLVAGGSYASAFIYFLGYQAFLFHRLLTMYHSDTPSDDESRIKKAERTFLQEHDVENWLETIAATQYPSLSKQQADTVSPLKIVYPFKWNHDPLLKTVILNQNRSAGIIHAQWKPGTEHYYGVANQNMPEEEGGHTVQGAWPDQLSDLTLIPVLKNAHTQLLNSVADLSQRLKANFDHIDKQNGAIKVQNMTQRKKNFDRIKEIMENAADRQTRQSLPGHAVFAIIRDPVDRFLSSTCQDLSMDKAYRGRIDRAWNNGTALDIVDILLERIQTNQNLQYHQMHQVTQIASVVEGVPVGVTLVPQNLVLPDLLLELGGHNIQMRSRTNTSDYKKAPIVESLCMLKTTDLSKEQIDTICWIYSADVRMFTLVNIDVPLCPPLDTSRAPFTIVPPQKPKRQKPKMTKARLEAVKIQNELQKQKKSVVR